MVACGMHVTPYNIFHCLVDQLIKAGSSLLCPYFIFPSSDHVHIYSLYGDFHAFRFYLTIVTHFYLSDYFHVFLLSNHFHTSFI